MPAASFYKESTMSDWLPAKTHELKTDPEVFQLSWGGKKPFEIRYDDRIFRVGDELVLMETHNPGLEMKEGKPLLFTGRRIRQKVISIISGYGMQPGWCVMGVEEMHRMTDTLSGTTTSTTRNAIRMSGP
jgi:hypothetical protein